MLPIGRPFALLACLPLLAVPLSAQLATAPQHQLQALSIDGVLGGTASLEFAAYTQAGQIASDVLASFSYTAQLGFLAIHDPQAGNQPVLFGIQPGFGPVAGGTPLSISGLNFDKFGTGQLLTVTIDGQPATAVTVESDTLITATSPPGLSGPRDVAVTGPLGSASDPGGFVYTPAIVTTPTVPIGDPLQIRNYGPPGDSYWTFIAVTAWSAPTKFGTLLIGPDVIQLLPPTPYPPSDGAASLTILVPDDPVLHGLQVHFQSLSVSQLSPLAGTLTNASVTLIP